MESTTHDVLLCYYSMLHSFLSSYFPAVNDGYNNLFAGNCTIYIIEFMKLGVEGVGFKS